MENPSYFSVLPANVRYDKELKANEKLLYSEIVALSNKNGYCTAKNKYFAELYDVHKKTISDWISHLRDRGYIDIELIYDGKSIVGRKIFIGQPIREKMDTYPSNDGYPIREITDYNNTSINNKQEEKENKESEDEDISFSNNDEVICFYENNICLITPYVAESINEYRAEGLQDDLLITAMQDAVSRNKRSWKYIEATLKDCRRNNVFTAEQFEIKQREFKEQIKANKSFKKQCKKEAFYNTDFSEYDEYAKKQRSG